MAFKRYGKKRVAPLKRRGAKGFKKVVRRYKKRVFKNRVIRALASVAETKILDFKISDASITGPKSSDFQSNMFCLSPTDATPGLKIDQGTGQGQRVGNKITVKSVSFTGVVRPLPQFDNTFNYNPCPMYLVLWVVSLRSHLPDTKAQLETTVLNTFFQDGNSSIGVQGNLQDLTRKVNTSVINVHKRRVFKLGYATYPSGFSPGNAANIYQAFNNNDFQLSSMFRMNLKMPKTLTYNDGTLNPSCRRWWMFCIPYRCDNADYLSNIGTTTGPTPAKIDFGIEMKYTDM